MTKLLLFASYFRKYTFLILLFYSIGFSTVSDYGELEDDGNMSNWTKSGNTSWGNDGSTSTWVNAVPVVSCILITFGYGLGLGPVPFILFGELFPGITFM